MRPLASAVSSLVGQVIDGKYAIVSRIAEGGTSTVYLGVNQRIGKDVAVKVLRTLVACDPEARERFEREARIVSRIRSAHVADVFDFGELPTGERFMVMEYLEGESLAKLIQRDEPMPVETLGIIALQILDALAAAHSIGVVHRDLKPENVIVATRRGELVAKVVDFGISKIDGALSVRSPNLSTTTKTNSSDGTASRLTLSGSVLGTPLYMSPEQASGETALVDRRTDIYSLGVILYEALCGEPPITGDEMNELLFRIVLEEPRPLAERVPTVDQGLAAIVERALAKDPNHRYQTADEMRLALEKWRARAAVPVGEVLDEVKEAASSEALASSDVFARLGRVRRWAFAALFATLAVVAGVPFVSGLMGSSESKTQTPPPPPSPAPESTGVRTSELSINMARAMEGAAYSRRPSVGSARASRAGEQQEK